MLYLKINSYKRKYAAYRTTFIMFSNNESMGGNFYFHFKMSAHAHIISAEFKIPGSDSNIF